jgi:hypothetical protein
VRLVNMKMRIGGDCAGRPDQLLVKISRRTGETAKFAGALAGGWIAIERKAAIARSAQPSPAPMPADRPNASNGRITRGPPPVDRTALNRCPQDHF